MFDYCRLAKGMRTVELRGTAHVMRPIEYSWMLAKLELAGKKGSVIFKEGIEREYFRPQNWKQQIILYFFSRIRRYYQLLARYTMKVTEHGLKFPEGTQTVDMGDKLYSRLEEEGFCRYWPFVFLFGFCLWRLESNPRFLPAARVLFFLIVAHCDKVILNERDAHVVGKILRSSEKDILVYYGAGHVRGMRDLLCANGWTVIEEKISLPLQKLSFEGFVRDVWREYVKCINLTLKKLFLAYSRNIR